MRSGRAVFGRTVAAAADKETPEADRQDGITPRAVSLRTHLINRERVRCQRFGAAARREEGEYPPWIFDRRATRRQRQRSATLWSRSRGIWRTPGSVAPQSSRRGGTSAMLLRRALPDAGQSLAHSFPVYEMGSNGALAATPQLWLPALQPLLCLAAILAAIHGVLSNTPGCYTKSILSLRCLPKPGSSEEDRLQCWERPA